MIYVNITTLWRALLCSCSHATATFRDQSVAFDVPACLFINVSTQSHPTFGALDNDLPRLEEHSYRSPG